MKISTFFICLVITVLFVFPNVKADSRDHIGNTFPSLLAGNFELATPDFLEDTTPFARVVLYRPANQLSRKYEIKTDQHAPFSLKRKEIMALDTQSDKLEIEVSATGHKTESFSFRLSKDKVHYLRVQDRNNYSGMRPFLEVIEVTEATYLKDGVLSY